MTTQNETDGSSTQKLISYKKLFVLSLCFAVVILFAKAITLLTCKYIVEFDCPRGWPISIGYFFTPTIQKVFIAIAVSVFFVLCAFYLEKNDYRLPQIILAGILLVICTNAIQGIETGIYGPVSGSSYSGQYVGFTSEGQEFYHDIIRIKDPLELFLNYNEIQKTLNQHTHTHPPGAIFLFYFLLKLLKNPGLVSVFLAIISVSLSSFFLYKLLIAEVEPHTAGFVTFLFTLLPAVQIYYLATVDALIASTLLGTLYYFKLSFGSRKYLLAAVLFLCLSFSLSFVSLFILPVLVLLELIERRSLFCSTIVIGGLFVVHVIVFLLSGYNALVSFRTASSFENPHGFMLFVHPVNYLFTRLEDIAEPILFFGPLMLFLLVRGLKEACSSVLFRYSLLGIFTLFMMFATGAYRTGETARAAIFIVPYLLFPVALYLDSIKLNREARLQLICFVFAQALIMQFLGGYHY